jgi:hypothetical protein
MEHLPAGTWDAEAINAAFAAPDIDGRFDESFAAAAKVLGRRRPLVLLTFAPRSGGTFLRTAAIEATGGQLIRLAHAEGGRDGTLYLPWLIAYYNGALTADAGVTHQHMQACLANRCMIDAFDLHPAVMARSIPDMLASLLAMIEADDDMAIGFSFLKPAGFAQLPRVRKADILIDIMGPWYAQYFAGWKAYAGEQPSRVLLLDYGDFCNDPAEVLEAVLAHARIPRPYETCRAAIDTVWRQRALFRCNRGGEKREAIRFTQPQLKRLERFVSYYDTLTEWRELLLTPTA